MSRHSAFPDRAKASGNSLIELALLLPVLLTLVLGVIDHARAIHFNNILISMSREGANLASRTTASPQYIINALNVTATPLEMGVNGMVYITTVIGLPDGTGRVQDQYHATTGNTALLSHVYGCTSWGVGGRCTLPTPGPVVTLDMPLMNGELVHVVEAAYNFVPLVGYVLTDPVQLYSRTTL